MDSFSLKDIKTFKLFISPYMGFGDLHLSRNGLLHVNYQICGHKVVHNITLLSFYCPCYW